MPKSYYEILKEDLKTYKDKNNPDYQQIVNDVNKLESLHKENEKTGKVNSAAIMQYNILVRKDINRFLKNNLEPTVYDEGYQNIKNSYSTIKAACDKHEAENGYYDTFSGIERETTESLMHVFDGKKSTDVDFNDIKFLISKRAYLKKLRTEFNAADTPEWKQDILNEIYGDQLDSNVKKFMKEDELGIELSQVLDKNQALVTADVYTFDDHISLANDAYDRYIKDAIDGVVDRKYMDNAPLFDKKELTEEERKIVADVADEIDAYHSLYTSLNDDPKRQINPFFDTVEIRYNAKTYGRLQPIYGLEEEAPELSAEEKKDIALEEKTAKYNSYQDRIKEIKDLKAEEDKWLESHGHLGFNEEVRQHLVKQSEYEKSIQDYEAEVKVQFGDWKPEPKIAEPVGAGQEPIQHANAAPKPQSIREITLNEYQKHKDDRILFQLYAKTLKQEELNRRKDNPEYEQHPDSPNKLSSRIVNDAPYQDARSKLITDFTTKKINAIQLSQEMKKISDNTTLVSKYNKRAKVKRTDRSKIEPEIGDRLLNPEKYEIQKEAPKDNKIEENIIGDNNLEEDIIQPDKANEEIKPEEKVEEIKTEEIKTEEIKTDEINTDEIKVEENEIEKSTISLDEIGKLGSILEEPEKKVEKKAEFVDRKPDMIKLLEANQKGVWGGSKQYDNILENLKKIVAAEKKINQNANQYHQSDEKIRVARKKNLIGKMKLVSDMTHYINRKHDEMSKNPEKENQNSKKRRLGMEKIMKALKEEIKHDCMEQQIVKPDRGMNLQMMLHELKVGNGNGRSTQYKEILHSVEDLSKKNPINEENCNRHIETELNILTVMQTYLNRKTPMMREKDGTYKFYTPYQDNNGKPIEPKSDDAKRVQTMLTQYEKFAELTLNDVKKYQPEKYKKIATALESTNTRYNINIKTNTAEKKNEAEKKHNNEKQLGK